MKLDFGAEIFGRVDLCQRREFGTNDRRLDIVQARGERDALVRHFKAEGIGCEIYYPMPLHLQECLAYLGHGPGDFPASEEASNCVLAFPMFPEITIDQQRRVVGSVSAYLRKPARRAA